VYIAKLMQKGLTDPSDTETDFESPGHAPVISGHLIIHVSPMWPTLTASHYDQSAQSRSFPAQRIAELIIYMIKSERLETRRASDCPQAGSEPLCSRVVKDVKLGMFWKFSMLESVCFDCGKLMWVTPFLMPLT
jgi:hypothetical protein